MGGSGVSGSMLIIVVWILCLCGGGTQAATFTITNNCTYTVWAASFNVTSGGGWKLNSEGATKMDVKEGTSGARVWARTNCKFDGAGKGQCETGDCGGEFYCKRTGAANTTLAQFSLNQAGNLDYYDISNAAGYNLGMAFSPTNSQCDALSCPDDANPRNPWNSTRNCPSGSDYHIVFCP
ncbi:unnamed protein product [Cuscuta europaea]|uniref:Thaumatin-like protein n=1 Tax=Cuscuta europaea TaxID=41803 RepID=A0A9P0Z7A7_CUSEU|nr:unnamed protein product [Cuscuta europaea]